MYLTPGSVTPAAPSGHQNLLKLYGLEGVAASVARTDADGVKRKLRKSYKNHIADLPGKYTIPTKEEGPTLVDMIRKPPMQVQQIKDIAPDVLAQIKFARSPHGGIPGFGPKLFNSAPEANPDKKRKDKEKDGNVEKKRRII